MNELEKRVTELEQNLEGLTKVVVDFIKLIDERWGQDETAKQEFVQNLKRLNRAA